MLETLLVLSGAFAGYFLLEFVRRYRLGSYQKIAAEIISKAESDIEFLHRRAELDLRQKELEQAATSKKQSEQELAKLQHKEEKIRSREERLEYDRIQLDKDRKTLAERESQVKEELLEQALLKQQLEKEQAALSQKLEKIAGFSSEDGKQALLKQLTDEIKAEEALHIHRSMQIAQEEIEKRTVQLLVGAMQRLALSCVSERTVETIAIPSDEMKRRIIGREGRNIRTLELETGVNFSIDDTPGVVLLSCFDPVRLRIAKMTLIALIADGRIHPTKIEEAVEKIRQQLDLQIKQYGEEAAAKTGQLPLHPELIHLLGKLKFRFSHGQNVLDHSLEVAHLMGLIAAELRIDVALAKRIGLLHDIGKAVSHEYEGTHALVGRDIALKCGESVHVANGIGCHHGEIEPTSLEGSLCSSADAISASRPGARVEAVEDSLRRLKRLEELAHEFPGVERAYAMQGGKEMRVFVTPHQIDDAEMVQLARRLTKKIESSLSFGGKIKVTVVRENRIVDYAI